MLGSRRLKVRAMLAVVLALAVAIAAVVRHFTTGYVAHDASWQLLGVSRDGRTLEIQEPGHGACDRVRSRVDDRHDDRIEVSVEILEPRGTESCILMLVPGDDVALRLGRPVAGRPIVGPKKRLAPPYRVDHRGRSDRTQLTARPKDVPATDPPTVVGLRYVDARDALCNAGFQARPTGGDHARGMVVAQQPPLRQRATGPRRTLKCTNGLLPAVALRLEP